MATKPEYVTPAHNSYEELEELFWKDLLNDKALPPIYGADVCDSITDKVGLVFPGLAKTSGSCCLLYLAPDLDLGSVLN